MTKLKLMLVAKGYYSNHEYLNFTISQHENFNQNTPSNLHIKFFNANRIFINIVEWSYNFNLLNKNENI